MPRRLVKLRRAAWVVSGIALVSIVYTVLTVLIGTTTTTTTTTVYQTKSQSSDSRKNVLFLMADDLRPQLGSYEGPYHPNPGSKATHMVSPNLDRLASKSLLLRRAYVQLSMCGPSRASLLTGRRPDTTKVWNQKGYWRVLGGNYTTIPQYFKENGYITSGVGKIFHPRKASGKDDPISWTTPYYQPPDKKYWRKLGVSWQGFDEQQLAERPHPDFMIAKEGIERLKKLAPLAKSGKPFFLAVGFLKPHLPFTFPSSFLKFYPEENVDLPDNRYLPTDFPIDVYSKPMELLAKADIKKLTFKGNFNETLSEDTTRALRRAYFACTSYIDYLVGKVLEELEKLGLAESTVVSFVGDHGWHLGENGMWGKHTNMEQGTHAPMMIRIPGKTDSGIISDSIVEFVDLFPTIAEAAGLKPVPSCPRQSTKVQTCSEGLSILPLMENPTKSIKPSALSQHKLYRTPGMGYSIRTERYRYTEWPKVTRKRNRETQLWDYEILWDNLVGAELYDYKLDPREKVNRAYDQSYQGVRTDHNRRLRQQVTDFITGVKVPFE